jgi:NAD-dependent aldehyde dehydrogenases
MNISDIQHLITEKAAKFLARGTHSLLIDGQWVPAQSGQTMDVINPANEEVLGKVPSAGKADVELAVSAARRAFDHGPWSKMHGTERERLLLKLADLLEANAQSFAEVEAMDNGKSAAIARVLSMWLFPSIPCATWRAGPPKLKARPLTFRFRLRRRPSS